MTPANYQTDAAAAAQGAVLKLQPHGATPPVNAYVTASQFLQITVYSASSTPNIQVQYQMLLPDGRIVLTKSQLTLNGTRAQQTFFLPLTEGFIIQLILVYIGGVGFANRTFVRCSLSNATTPGNTTTQVLTQGYLTNQSFLSWPPGVTNDALDGAGAVVDVTGTTPGAGAEISETVPTGATWQLKAFTFQLTASAAVANRIPHLIIDDGTHVLLDSPAPTALVAGVTNRYVTGDNAIASAAVDSTQWLQSVAAIRLLPGYRIRTLTTGLQAGDQYTAPQYLVTEWLCA